MEPRTDPRLEDRLTHRATPHHHGNSIAAWTTVSIVIVGFLLSGVAVIVAIPPLFWVGLVIAAVGVVSGKVLSMAGYGAMPSYRTEEPTSTSLEGPDLAPMSERTASAEPRAGRNQWP